MRSLYKGQRTERKILSGVLKGCTVPGWPVRAYIDIPGVTNWPLVPKGPRTPAGREERATAAVVDIAQETCSTIVAVPPAVLRVVVLPSLESSACSQSTWAARACVYTGKRSRKALSGLPEAPSTPPRPWRAQNDHDFLSRSLAPVFIYGSRHGRPVAAHVPPPPWAPGDRFQQDVHG